MAELWDILDAKGNKTGRLHERGKPLADNDYFLTVQIWILNRNNEFLLAKRTPERNGKWHTPGGCVIAGEDSLTCALREAKEEIGIDLDPECAQLYKRITLQGTDYDGYLFADVWLFRQDVDISDTVLQPEEVSDVMWADKGQIEQMLVESTFAMPADWYPYLNDEFLDYVINQNNYTSEGVGK